MSPIRDISFGPWTGQMEANVLRRLCWHGHEVARALVGEVLNRNRVPVSATWRLEPGVWSPELWVQRFHCFHRHEDVDYRWEGCLTVSSEEFSFEFRGAVASAFLSQGVGLSVQHPMEAAGRPYHAVFSDGSVQSATFPTWIAPTSPLRQLASLSYRASDQLQLEVHFEGAAFEMEDRRNWTDACFRSHAMAPAGTGPVQIHVGDTVTQTIRLRPRVVAPGVFLGGPVRITAGALLGPRPLIGLALTPGEPVPLRVDYLRADPDQLDEARVHGLPLEIALTLGAGQEDGQLRSLDLRSDDRVLLFHEDHPVSPAPWLVAARQWLPGAILIGGTDDFFAELNRDPPSPDLVDGFTCGITPQVHDDDGSSIMATLAAQRDLIASMRRLAGGKPVGISTLSFRMRHNPYASDGTQALLAERSDPRQAQPFGVAFLMGSFKALGEGGAATLTCFETGGALGIAGTDLVAAMSAFLSIPQARFRAAESTAPNEVQAWILEADGQRLVCLFNLTDQKQSIEFEERGVELGPYETVYL
jgi:hypothetical protein